jgi:hypothetical protein
MHKVSPPPPDGASFFWGGGGHGVSLLGRAPERPQTAIVCIEELYHAGRMKRPLRPSTELR